MTCPNFARLLSDCCSVEGGSFGEHAMHDTASRRASPTLALLMPACLAIRIAQLFSLNSP